MSVTLSNLRTIFYDILREESNSSAYPYTLSDLMLNSAQQDICNWLVINPLTKEAVNKWTLPFLNTDQYYSNVDTTSLSADTTVWATTLTVSSTTDFPSTWSLYIAGDIITYTGTTSTEFTGCSGVSFAFESGMEISIAFALPTDYANPINVTYNNKFKLPWKVYNDLFEDLNDIKGNYYQRNRARSMYVSPYRIKPFYTIKDNAYMIIFNLNDTDWITLLRYEKLPEDMTATTDTATIDNDTYAKAVIPYIAVWEMLFNRWEEGRAAEIINFGMWKLKAMYRYYNNTGFEKQSWVNYGMWKSRFNI